MSGSLGTDLWDAIGPMGFALALGAIVLLGLALGLLSAKFSGLMPRWRGWWPSVKEMDEWDERKRREVMRNGGRWNQSANAVAGDASAKTRDPRIVKAQGPETWGDIVKPTEVHYTDENGAARTRRIDLRQDVFGTDIGYGSLGEPIE